MDRTGENFFLKKDKDFLFIAREQQAHPALTSQLWERGGVSSRAIAGFAKPEVKEGPLRDLFKTRLEVDRLLLKNRCRMKVLKPLREEKAEEGGETKDQDLFGSGLTYTLLLDSAGW